MRSQVIYPATEAPALPTWPGFLLPLANPPLMFPLCSMPSTTIETLADNHTPGQPWHVYCDVCRRHATLDPEKVIEERGPDFPMARLRAMVRCKECGRKGQGIVIHTPSDGRPG